MSLRNAAEHRSCACAWCTATTEELRQWTRCACCGATTVDPYDATVDMQVCADCDRAMPP